MKIFMVGEAASHKERLAARLEGGHELIGLPREAAHSAEFDSQINGDDVVVSLRFTREATVPEFRLLHVPGAGIDGINFGALPDSCWVCNVFEHEIPVAEYAVWSMLQWQIRPDEMRRAFSLDAWANAYRNRRPHDELFAKTVGLVGFGRIGRAIAERARSFGTRVVAVDANLEAAGPSDELLPPSDLPRLLEQSDFVVVACPLNDRTRGMIGAAEFERMKSTAVLINVSRAEIVAEDALFKALQGKVIAGAFLDVWYRYPKEADDEIAPSRFPFDQLSNVVCTPHSCAWTSALPDRRYAIIAENLKRLESGRPLLNVVRAPIGAA